MLASFAEAQGLAIASLFTDQSKLYEHVDHKLLCDEALEAGFPPSLLAPIRSGLLGLPHGSL